MNLLTRLTVLGKFSIRCDDKRIKITQKDYTGILFLVTCLLCYPLINYAYIVANYSGIKLLSLKSALLSSVLFIFAWWFLKTLQNLKAVLKHREILIIDKQKRVIIHDNWEIKTAEIDYAEIFAAAVREGYTYQLVFYPKLKFHPSTPEMEQEVKESTAFYVFVPTASAKLLIVKLANEINALTEKRIKVDFRNHIGDLFALFNILFFIAIFLICFVGVSMLYYVILIKPLLRDTFAGVGF